MRFGDVVRQGIRPGDKVAVVGYDGDDLARVVVVHKLREELGLLTGQCLFRGPAGEPVWRSYKVRKAVSIIRLKEDA